ncbi:MAG TPA: hypothetical protein VFI16_06340 [Anaeromyxobacteraceae bacterium]|nr:hypothetical protein [Anaeromyxobacteraceae bacterium]
MSETAALPVVRVKIPCADQREFLERFAPRYAQSGVFVPGARPRAVGSRIHLKLEFRDGTVGVYGDALVTGQETAGKPGMVLRFTALHAGSIQFELSPVGGAAAPAASTRHPQAPGKGELVDTLFGPDMTEGERAGSARPLEVRTGTVKLKMQETRGEPGAPEATPAESLPSLFPEATPAASEAPPREPTPAPAPATTTRGMRFWVAVVVLGLGVMAAVGLAVAGALASRRSTERADRLEAEVKAADARMLEGRLARPQGDSALDHLLAARDLSAGDARVASRLQALADTFEQLGNRAAARGDLPEAAIHLEAAVRADPGRAEAARKLDEVKARLAEGAPWPR